MTFRLAGMLLLGGGLLAAALPESARAGECPAVFAQKETRVPGAVIVSFEDARMEVVRCGEADLARKRPMSPDTVFQAASLSKPVTALIALALVDEGKLDLDRPLIDYLDAPYRHDQALLSGQPVWDTVDDPRLRKVTARQVLSHRSGLPNWAFGEPLRFAVEPGTEWKYSGEGFSLLATVLEHISGESLQALAMERVFTPLGMRDSSYVWRDAYAERIATGYDAEGKPLDTMRFRRPIAAASLYTTPADYARFVQALLLAAPDSARARLRERQVQVDAAYALGWGLGVGLEEHEQGDCLFHHGINNGFQSFFMACPAQRRGVLWFTNSDNGLSLAPELLETTLPGPHPVLGWPVLHP